MKNEIRKKKLIEGFKNIKIMRIKFDIKIK